MRSDKLSFFKILWIFTIGSILGYVGECLFYVVKYHNFVNKQGMIIGPFKPMYGLALIFGTILFKKLKANKKWQQLLYGAVFGAIFEFGVSFILEKIWNISMWDYSSFNLNIDGRVYLPYCAVWGLIGMIYYSYLFPLINYLYVKLYGKLFKIVSIILTIFIIFDSILTWMVFFRIGDYSKSNVVYNVVDFLFPPEKIDSRFSKVKVKD